MFLRNSCRIMCDNLSITFSSWLIDWWFNAPSSLQNVSNCFLFISFLAESVCRWFWLTVFMDHRPESIIPHVQILRPQYVILPIYVFSLLCVCVCVLLLHATSVLKLVLFITTILNQYKSQASPLVSDPVKAPSVPVSSSLLGAIVSSLSALCLAFPSLRYT